MNSKKFLDVLQIFRGIAALMVVIHHTVGSLRYYSKVDNVFLNFLGILGKYGVDFFFVLSGFIIAYSAYFKESNPAAFKSYIVNRIIRIYVPYLPIGLFMFFLYTSLPQLSSVSRDISWLTSLTLFPYGNPALSVAWTLTFEISFYLIFGLYFYSKYLLNVFFGLWAAVIICYQYFGTVLGISVFENKLFIHLLSHYNLEFLIGYILSISVFYFKAQYEKKILFLIAGLLFMFVFLINHSLFAFSSNLAFAILITLLLYYNIVYYTVSIPSSNVFMLIGNATYSIYLVHNPIQALVVRMLSKYSFPYQSYIVLLLVTFICVLVGYCYYFIFEKYAMNQIKNYLKKINWI